MWSEADAVRLVKTAWRSGYRGLAALLAVAWDSQLSPVDARGLKGAQMRRDPLGVWFQVDRAKTGRPALATLSRRAERMLTAYLQALAAEPIATSPIFRNRSGRPYTKDTLGDDFRAVRAIVFGPHETRQLADFRRSGSVEALAGDTPAREAVHQDGEQPVGIEPTAQDLWSGRAGLGARCGCCSTARTGQVREQKPDESVPPPVQKRPSGEGGDC